MSTPGTGDNTATAALPAAEGTFFDRKGNKRKWTRPDNFERISKQEKKRIRKERVAFNKAKRRDKHKSKMKTLRRKAREGDVPAEVVPEKRPSRHKLVHVMREVFAKRADYPAPHTVVIDASYNDNDPYETRSLAKQLNFIYARNRFHHYPLHTLMTSCVGPVKEAFEFRNGHNWKDFYTDPRDVLQIYPKDRIIILSDEGTEVLQELEYGKVYVIGGIVDRSTKKGLTRSKAEQHGLRSMRLPIKENISFRGRQTLNVNTVWNILHNFQEHRDWKKALSEEIPLRKQPGKYIPKGKKEKLEYWAKRGKGKAFWDNKDAAREQALAGREDEDAMSVDSSSSSSSSSGGGRGDADGDNTTNDSKLKDVAGDD